MGEETRVTMRTVPHRYIPEGQYPFRTCAVCGQGAWATIHVAPRKDDK